MVGGTHMAMQPDSLAEVRIHQPELLTAVGTDSPSCARVSQWNLLPHPPGLLPSQPTLLCLVTPSTP